MMRMPTVIVIALMGLACCMQAQAQELMNHALGKPYTVSPAPSESYTDDTGPAPQALSIAAN